MYAITPAKAKQLDTAQTTRTTVGSRSKYFCDTGADTCDHLAVIGSVQFLFHNTSPFSYVDYPYHIPIEKKCKPLFTIPYEFHVPNLRY